jgi:hypothetical protein
VRRARALLATAGVAGMTACARPPERAIAVACRSVATSAAAAVATDTLELIITVDSVPPGPGVVLVRVDPLSEPGVVTFSAPPPTAAAAGMALAPPPRFQGCAAIAPGGLELRAALAPRAKAWVRVSSDRVVRVRAVVGGRASDAPALVAPGSSGTVGWRDR